MATHGHPARYSFCMGEDEEGSPWEPLHVERGLAPEMSAVTVYCAEAPHNINDQVSKTPEMYLGSAASTMATLGGERALSQRHSRASRGSSSAPRARNGSRISDGTSRT